MALRRAITKSLMNGYKSNVITTQPSFFRQFSSTHTKILHQYMSCPNFKDPIGLRIESVALPEREETAVKGLTVSETKKLLRIYQTEKVKSRLREIEKSSVSYWEFLEICCESCGNDEEQGEILAKSLDLSGCVVVLGDIVFLHPHQVIHYILTTNIY
ncbi:unnamed protein product [Cochlearia groenlandica]